MSPAIIITGANGGIGKALCKTFNQEGYYVVATDKEASTSASADYYIQEDLVSLVSEPEHQKKFFASIHNQIKPHELKGLINNAALQKLCSLEMLSVEEFQATLAINVTAPLVLSKIFYTSLAHASGSIVNIGSIHSRLTKPAFISYSTSKAALLGLTQALAVDLGGKIRVNIIQPAATETEMLLAGFDGKEQSYELLKSYHPAQRIANTEEIAEAALFLVSEKCQFMTGSSINIDGAIGCRLHDPE